MALSPKSNTIEKTYSAALNDLKEAMLVEFQNILEQLVLTINIHIIIKIIM